MSKSLGNIVVPWEVHRAPRRRRVPLVLPHLQAAVGRLPVLGRRRSASRCASSCCSSGTPTASTSCTRTSTASRATPRAEPANDLDRWALSRLAATVETVTERLDAYDATRAGHAIAAFVDDLSNWYVRRSRRRFWDGDPAAFGDAAHLPGHGRAAARAVLPVHGRRDLRQPRRRRAERAPDATCPRPAARDVELEDAMAVVRETVRLGLAGARAGQAQGPPAAARGRRRRGGRRARGDRAARRRRARGAQRQGAALRLAGRRARLLRGQAELPRARPALRQADAAGRGRGRGARPGARRRARCATAAASASTSTATTTSSAPTTCMLAMQPLEGYQLEREGSHAVALELELDDELRREGLAREIVHAVQNARKAAGPRGRGPDRARRSAATRSCSPPRASTRRTWPARRSPSRSPTTASAGDAGDRSRAARCGIACRARAEL